MWTLYVASWSGYAVPITKLSRAASTTSRVTVCSALISRRRAICVRSRWSNRKLPPVTRIIAASASLSATPSSGKASPDGTHFCCRSCRTCAALRGRNACTKPTREWTYGRERAIRPNTLHPVEGKDIIASPWAFAISNFLHDKFPRTAGTGTLIRLWSRWRRLGRRFST
jgi:hypothetical protein